MWSVLSTSSPPCRWHLVKRERGGLDGGDAGRGRGQLEEHLLSRRAQGPGDASSGRKHARVHVAALSLTLAHRQHQEPTAQWRLLAAVGVMAAATQVSTPWCLRVHVFLLFLWAQYNLHPPHWSLWPLPAGANWNSDRASWGEDPHYTFKLTFQLKYSPLLYQWNFWEWKSFPRTVAYEFILIECCQGDSDGADSNKQLLLLLKVK